MDVVSLLEFCLMFCLMLKEREGAFFAGVSMSTKKYRAWGVRRDFSCRLQLCVSFPALVDPGFDTTDEWGRAGAHAIETSGVQRSERTNERKPKHERTNGRERREQERETKSKTRRVKG